MQALAVRVVMLGWLMLASAAVAQQPASSPEPVTATCTFKDGKQMSVRYDPVDSGKDLPNGTVWGPRGSPMTLFTETVLTLGTTGIPVGAYSMYVIPGKKEWTLVLNKNVAAGSPYDQKQDLVRAPMEMGQLSEPTPLQVAFAHMADRECHMRLYYGKTGTFVEFKEK